MVYTTTSTAETETLAERLANTIAPPHIFCLTGDLGAGKTAFTRGLARGYGSASRISSPTFTIMNIYEGKTPIYHFDLYRIASEEELEDIGFEEYLQSGIAVIEWPNRFLHMIDGAVTTVAITRTGDDTRKIEVKDGKPQ